MVIGLLIPISVLLIVAEARLQLAVFGVVVTRFALMSAGILGLIAAAFLIFVLFFSRFYQLCIGVYKYQKREIIYAAELASKLNNDGKLGQSNQTNMV